MTAIPGSKRQGNKKPKSLSDYLKSFLAKQSKGKYLLYLIQLFKEGSSEQPSFI